MYLGWVGAWWGMAGRAERVMMCKASVKGHADGTLSKARRTAVDGVVDNRCWLLAESGGKLGGR
jgi:hypothetical protein